MVENGIQHDADTTLVALLYECLQCFLGSELRVDFPVIDRIVLVIGMGLEDWREVDPVNAKPFQII